MKIAEGLTVPKLVDLLLEIHAMAEDNADADCQGDPPRFIPNKWMQLQTMIEEALKA